MNFKNLSKFFVAICLLFFESGLFMARADVRLPAIISDHMVLQRGMPEKIWGWSSPGENISVAMAGQQLRNPDANLVNAADLPGWPFRTDDWN